MARHWARISAKMADANHWIGNWDVVIDAMIDDNDYLIKRYTYFGQIGTIGLKNSAPVLLKPDGSVDFGRFLVETESEYPRYLNMNIHQKKIVVGEYFTHFHDEDEILLKIARITDLTEDFI